MDDDRTVSSLTWLSLESENPSQICEDLIFNASLNEIETASTI